MPLPRIVVAAVAVAAVAALLVTAAACTGSSGSKDKFCAALPGTDDVFALIGNLDTTDSARLQQRFDAGLAAFRKLERAAPREIRADVSTVGDAVERILQAVEKHPDDMGAVREDLARSSSSLLSSGKAALAVQNYARKECGITLDGSGVAQSPTTTTPPTTAADD